jgi:hypothetical protein
MASCPAGKKPVTIKAKGGRKARTFCAGKSKAERGGAKKPVSASRRAAGKAQWKKTCEKLNAQDWPGKSSRMILGCRSVLSGLGRMGRRSR